MTAPLLAVVERHLVEQQFINRGDAVVVAVSGGPDSVALLHILFLLSERYGWRLIAAHVNHRFRGEESDREAGFVAELADKLGLPCRIAAIDVPAFIEETALNAQTAARIKRYAFLHEVAEEFGAARIAFAHHADDQAETIVMRILRGTGPSGLAGMPERRREKKVELIRPLLRIYKSELLEYLAERDLRYCLDSSNAERKYFRNRIRHDVMPALRAYNDQFPEALSRLSEMMRAENDYMDRSAEQAFKTIVQELPDGCRMQRSDFAALHLALQRRLIKLILTYLSWPMESIDFASMERMRLAMLQARPANARITMQEGLTVVREYGDVFVRTAYTKPQSFAYELPIGDGQLFIPEAGWTIAWELTGPEVFSGKPSADEALFDVQLLEGPLVLRSRRDGDRIAPYGLNGSKKVKDMFINAKLPPSTRDRTPLLVDGAGQVLWIAGFRRSRHAAVTEQTVQVLRFTVTRRPEL
ncbi:tRNA lysidine(34) synthetase TilS [Paenibacillus athensensis]|uniref:tRNA(Ile)-lysidine synthase n=1 Tax=Paenibacillus athensensis TaxID=1967502 RepID=A0A4Y8PVJ6_9BACL|nr:tRNA lysidine(34) synthetase TilS [Paenibacillus athensensis]MCD1261874.1 tRNA lysidine(34) synthetase TilS [Paenibacillus athensensis]